MTELFFESAEPSFDELLPEEFFRRFPAGEYEVEGRTTDGIELESEVEVSHIMPAPAEVTVNYMPAAENCDVDKLPVVDDDDVILRWDSVKVSHPYIGVEGPVTIHNYEVVVEIDGTSWKTSTILPPEVTTFEIPEEILELSDQNDGEVKFEVLARAKNYNQTAIESCFVVE